MSNYTSTHEEIRIAILIGAAISSDDFDPRKLAQAGQEWLQQVKAEVWDKTVLLMLNELCAVEGGLVHAKRLNNLVRNPYLENK